jgi:ketosteroid isomerase-like protein
MSQENTELAEHAFAALARDGTDGLHPYLDPEIEWISIPGFLPDAVDRVGRDGVAKWFENLNELFEGLSWRLDEVVDGGDRVMVSCTGKGRGRSSGIEAEMTVFMAASVRGGCVTRIESFLSRNQALKAAGLSE